MTSRVIAVICVVLICGQAPAARTMRGGKAKVKVRDDFYADTRLHTIHIQLSREAWAQMMPTQSPRYAAFPERATKAPTTAPTTRPEGERLGPNPWNYRYAYFRSTVEIDGEAIADVGVRFKGNLSFAAAVGGPHRPMKLEFGRFVAGRKFRGISTLNLNNNTCDPTQLREVLAYSIFRDAGVPAPRTSYAAVYLTVDGVYKREYIGLYNLIEAVDRNFLKRQFKGSKGLLLKPEGVRGMPWLGESWPRYAQRYNPKSGRSDADRQRLIDFLTLVHFADDATFRARVGAFLAVDEYLRFVAVQAMLSNMDSVLCTGHNYYIYINPSDQRIHVIPWDMHLSFGSFALGGTVRQQQELSVLQAFVRPNRLLERLMGIDEYARAYRGHLEQLAAGAMSRRNVEGRMAEFRATIAMSDEVARKAGRYGSPTTRPTVDGWLAVPPLDAFVRARIDSIAAQLAGKVGGHIPGSYDSLPASNGYVAQRQQSLVESGAGLFAMMDANRDGKLTEAELRAGVGSIFAEADVAHKGRIDGQALARAMAERVAMPSVHVYEPGPGIYWARILFAHADANGDKAMTLEELAAGLGKAFSAMGGEKKGFVTAAEFNRMLTGLVATHAARASNP